MKAILLLPFFAIFILPMNAQEFKGQMMDSKQRPLKGLKVWRKNTMESVMTDKLGIFLFPAVSSADTLVISVSKSEEIVIPVNLVKEVFIKVEKNFYLLFDGTKETQNAYKKVARTRINSNVLTREQILRLSPNTIYDLFKGSMPGVTVKDSSSGRKISIRGGSGSFQQDTEPLFIINGRQYESSNEADGAFSASETERVEVNKDGAGYGVRGANGVIIITTIKFKSE